MTLVLITNEYPASESLIMGVSNYYAYECFIVERWKVHLGCWIFVGQLFASLFTFFDQLFSTEFVAKKNMSWVLKGIWWQG